MNKKRELMKISRTLSRLAHQLDRAAKKERVDPDLGELERMDLEKMARKYMSIASVLEKLEAEIEDQVGHMIEKHDELSSEMKKLQNEVRDTVPPVKSELIDLHDLMMKFHVVEYDRTRWTNVVREEFPELLEKEFGDRLARLIMDVLEEAEEVHTKTYRRMNEFEVMDKESSIRVRRAGGIDWLRKMIRKVKELATDLVDFLKFAKDRILGKTEKANEGLQLLMESVEAAKRA